MVDLVYLEVLVDLVNLMFLMNMANLVNFVDLVNLVDLINVVYLVIWVHLMNLVEVGFENNPLLAAKLYMSYELYSPFDFGEELGQQRIVV